MDISPPASAAKTLSPHQNLWRNNKFLQLWFGETVSLLGSQVTALALPLTAAITLNATPANMGLLGAAQFAPFLLITLLAGVWVDRLKRRPILMIANLGRAVLIGLIPLLALLGRLRMESLYIIGFFSGILTVFFDLAYQSFLPTLVRREQLVEANSKLQLSASLAEISGPGVGGVLVEWISAPMALAADALSYIVSLVSLLFIGDVEPKPPAPSQMPPFRQEIGDGMRAVFGNRYLRAIVGEAATYNLFNQAIAAIFVLYATRELGIGPALLGMIFAAGSLGSLLGALLADPAAHRIGTGYTILASMIIACAAPILIPLAVGPLPLVIAILMISYFVSGIGVTVSNVHVVSLRQAVTPERLLGRMNASYRLFIYGAIPVGSLLGGTLGEWIGLRPSLFVASLGLTTAVLWVLFSAVPRLRSIPARE